MKKEIKTWIYPFIFLGVMFFLTNSCSKKEETPSPSAKKNPVITWANPANIVVGTYLGDLQLNATADVPGTFYYQPPKSTRLNLSENQDLKVMFNPTDYTHYNSVSRTVKITVVVEPIIFNPKLTYGTMTDIEGNVYKTINIGTQTWMAENMRTTKYRNGDLIPNVTDDTAWHYLSTGAYCNLQNFTGFETLYGRLYNWYAVNDSRNIAPSGWHVPSSAEWTILRNYLGGEYVAGGKLKETGTTHWKSPNNDATNQSGFTGLPGESRFYEGYFGWIDFSGGYWWSSSEYDSEHGYNMYFGSGTAWMAISDGHKKYGFSVRCLKD
ncbi:MAG: fibrobacter succinogenes major paralogous domain-containing protein [Bacteroidetes bacterium]|nr:fibrobacter succinogenes major paralogous domain-containing protein [Bacteroidota bacterium]